jgi:hypothetical protein
MFFSTHLDHNMGSPHVYIIGLLLLWGTANLVRYHEFAVCNQVALWREVAMAYFAVIAAFMEWYIRKLSWIMMTMGYIHPSEYAQLRLLDPYWSCLASNAAVTTRLISIQS